MRFREEYVEAEEEATADYAEEEEHGDQVYSGVSLSSLVHLLDTKHKEDEDDDKDGCVLYVFVVVTSEIDFVKQLV